MQTNSQTVIVVGAGVSGSSAALTAADMGVEVLLFSRAAPRRSLSCLDVGGFNAALDTKGEDDSEKRHAEDTLSCGASLSHRGMVEEMCGEAPSAAGLFDRMGAAFARTPEGMADLVKLAGSSCRRSLYSHSGVGGQLSLVLDLQLRRQIALGKIRLFEGWEFMSLVIDDAGACRGIVASNRSNMETKAFPAKAVVVATGGFEGLWGSKCTRPSADGSGVSACYEQGAVLANPEFVQFVPFAVAGFDACHPVCALMLAAGAQIQVPRESSAWRFLTEWYPDSGGLVTDDLGIRAFYRMVVEGGHGIEGRYVNADLSGIDDGLWGRSFGDRLDIFGRITGEEPRGIPLRVSPATSMTLGGLWVDPKHATSIPGLYAAGSASCSYHGACALPGNELPASWQGGRVAGRGAAFAALGGEGGEVSSSLLDSAKVREEDLNVKFARQQGDESAHAIMRELSEIMSSAAFFAKENKGLSSALAGIDELEKRFESAPLSDRREWANPELFSMRAISRSFGLARAVLAASAARDESRGVFFKPAFPERDDRKWQVVTKVKLSGSAPDLEYSGDVADAD